MRTIGEGCGRPSLAVKTADASRLADRRVLSAQTLSIAAADWIAERRHRIAEIAILGEPGRALFEALREREGPLEANDSYHESTGEYFAADIDVPGCGA